MPACYKAIFWETISQLLSFCNLNETTNSLRYFAIDFLFVLHRKGSLKWKWAACGNDLIRNNKHHKRGVNGVVPQHGLWPCMATSLLLLRSKQVAFNSSRCSFPPLYLLKAVTRCSYFWLYKCPVQGTISWEVFKSRTFATKCSCRCSFISPSFSWFHFKGAFWLHLFSFIATACSSMVAPLACLSKSAGGIKRVQGIFMKLLREREV